MQVPRCQVRYLGVTPKCLGAKYSYPGVDVSNFTQHLNHPVTPTQSTWRHMARCHFSFWSYVKSAPKIIKKIVKNLDSLLHYDPTEKIRVHPLDVSERGAPGEML